MYEVILYAAIATIVCVMLYTVLGKSVGQGPESKLDAEKAIRNFTQNNNKVVQLEKPSGPPTGLEAIAQADSNFSPAYFMDGAKAAYSMILEAFAAGDKEQLESLLTPDVYKVYLGATSERRQFISEDLTLRSKVQISEILERTSGSPCTTLPSLSIRADVNSDS